MCRLVVLALAATALADSWAAYGTKTFESPDGKRKLVVRQDRSFQLGETKGTLPQLPMDAHVLPKGAVLFERYGRVGYSDVVARLTPDGKIAWRVGLGRLFDKKTTATFLQTLSSILWYRAWWVDEARGRVVLVSRRGHVREVALADGKVALGGPEGIVAGIAVPHACATALELAADMKLKGAMPVAAPMAADKSLPPGVRLRAALVVQALGGPAAKAELFAPALGKQQPLKERRFAIERLAELQPQGGLDLLESAALSRETAYPAVRALHKMRAAKALASVIASGDTATGTRDYASQMLGKLPAAQVGEAVAGEFADADADVAGALLRAGIEAGVPDLSKLVVEQEETLIRALDRGHAPIDWTADHFAKHPSTEAVDALLKTFRKNERHPRRGPKLIAALKACTGLDFGTTYKAWRNGLRRTGAR